jgi:hypothetical protein
MTKDKASAVLSHSSIEALRVACYSSSFGTAHELFPRLRNAYGLYLENRPARNHFVINMMTAETWDHIRSRILEIDWLTAIPVMRDYC